MTVGVWRRFLRGLERLFPYNVRLVEEFETSEARRRLDTGFFILLTIFLTCLVTCQVMSFKLWVLGPLVLAAGTIPYAVTFLCTDIISEVYGREASEVAVLCGLVANLVLVACIVLGWLLPPLEPSYQRLYEQTLLFTPRVVAASIVAYIIAQTHDVIAFHYWKARTRGKHLWLRNNASTMVSQLIDTVVFTVLAFAGVVDNTTLLNMILSMYLIKLVCAALDTPFCYLGAKLLKPRVVEAPAITTVKQR